MSEKRAQYEHMRGNAHAQKYDKPTNASLSVRCNQGDKERWQAAAKAENMSLNQWVIGHLNKFV